MIINHNLSSMTAYRNLTSNSAAQSKSMEKLSTGLRINKAADDAAGLAISEKMRAQIRGLDQAQRNAQDGISLIQTAEGGLNETHSILQRMRELTVQAASDTNETQDRAAIKSELDELIKEIDHISDSTKFNGTTLFESTTTTFALQIGATNDAADKMDLDLTKIQASASSLGVSSASITVSSNSFATQSLGYIDDAIKKVSEGRAYLGANQNRLEHTISNLGTSSENLTAAESRIRDVDMAKEVMTNSKNNILSQAAQAMLAQANQQPQSVLQLLR
ncbi:flagellin [Ammoniphilus sp. 3BR4]|uniref:flagellin N-terminal helical domain-containing protein n=1 Tax=Ammoniphilus sp. 3BR4 TaxID=3158265 RepID=UPI003466DE86